MEKNCYTCKWRYKDTCNCKDFNNSFSVSSEKNGVEYCEQGYLNEALRENLNTSEVIELIIEKLIEENFIKKSFLNKKLSYESSDDIEQNLHELIDGALYKSLENFFNNSIEKIEIDDKNFRCKYWE